MQIPKHTSLTLTTSQTAQFYLVLDDGSIQQGTTTAATELVLRAPADLSRAVEFLSIYNNSGLANTFTLVLDQTTPVNVFKAVMGIGESAIFDGDWKAYTTTGELK